MLVNEARLAEQVAKDQEGDAATVEYERPAEADAKRAGELSMITYSSLSSSGDTITSYDRYYDLGIHKVGKSLKALLWRAVLLGGENNELALVSKSTMMQTWLKIHTCRTPLCSMRHF